jgi:hypothetical protein
MVDLDKLGFAADDEFIFKLGVFDTSTNVGEGENHFVVLEDDRFFLGRRWWGLYGEAGGGGDRSIQWGSDTPLESFLPRSFRIKGGLVLGGVIEIDGEQAAAKGKDDPGFSIVHGGVVGKLRMGCLMVTGAGLRSLIRASG